MARNSCSVTFSIGEATRHFQFWSSISVGVRECDGTLGWLGKHVAFSVGAAAENLHGKKQKPVRPFWHLSVGALTGCFQFGIHIWREFQSVMVHLGSSS